MFEELNGPPERRNGDDGFSLIEMMLVVAVGIILAAMAIPVSSNFISTARADSSIIAALDALETARDRSVAERRNFEVSFVNPNHIRVERVEVPSGLKTLISDNVLENGQQFVKFVGLPDTPDAFGVATSISFGGTAPWMFTSDGTFIDSNGDPVNGTILLGVPNQPSTARAVTVFGVTGLTRSWKWRGTKWFQ
jgi:prepilin-type N-terminal cleavage/methylation domain-containing protein